MKQKFRDFESAREFVRKLNLKGLKEWREYCKSGEKPDDIPPKPDYTYSKDYKGVGDWLGTGRVSNKDRQFLSFEKAKKFVQSLELKSQTQWKEYRKSKNRPSNIPSNPNLIYKKQWKGMGDFLGTGNVAPSDMVFLSFEKAKKFVQSLELKSQTQWIEYCKSGNKPDNIPQKPARTYKNKGWDGFGDWLGTGRVADQFKQYRPFSEAREFVRSLGLKSRKEWDEYCKSGNKPDDIPTGVTQTYKNDFKGMGDWLGTGTIQTQQRKYLSFKEARIIIQQIAKDNNIKTRADWARAVKNGIIPKNIPSVPWHVYAKNKRKKK